MGFTDDVTESDGPGSSSRVPASHSRFVQRVRRRYAAELPLLAPGMPRGEHIAALIKERTRSRDVPIVFVTGRDRDPTTIVRAFEVGAVDYVMKPFTASVIRQTEVWKARAPASSRGWMPRSRAVIGTA